MPDSAVRSGYLVIADISGYTAFLTGNELEHAQGAIEDLTRAILAALGPPARVVKLEGDAVFVYIPDTTVTTAERVLEIIERCYCQFADRRDDMQRMTTCTCSACAAIDKLDLKFVAHHGSFVIQRLAGTEDLAGPDVILIHRLLKNDVVAKTGITAYAFLTSALLEKLDSHLQLPPHEEQYESLGTVRGAVEDLHAVLAAARDARHVVVEPADADLVVDFRVPAPPPVAWDICIDPALQLRFFSGLTDWTNKGNDAGRLGVGATSHCAHGGGGLSEIRYLDWRPFEYMTTEKVPVKRNMQTPPHMMDTTSFRDEGDGTTLVTFRARALDRGLRTRLMLPMMRVMLRRDFRRAEGRIAAYFASEAAGEAVAPGG